MRPFTALLSSTLLLSGCFTYGTRPGDMTIAQHEAMARAEERAAVVQEAQFDPSAKDVREFCNASSMQGADVCWASVANPTANHLARSEWHLKMAARHREASQALRDAEAVACAGVSLLDRTMSPFEHREEIARVELVDTNVPERRTLGTKIFFRAVPGLDAERLQRLVDCHLARNGALGNAMPEMPFCPLMLEGVAARVVASGGALGVEVTSKDPDVVHEIVRRSFAILSR